MRYSLPNNSRPKSSNKTNNKTIDFQKNVTSTTHQIPEYNTVSASDVSTRNRTPYAPPYPSNIPTSSKSITLPKATYPTSTYNANDPNSLNLSYGQVSSMDYFVTETSNLAGLTIPELSHSIYHSPVGVSLMPIYGYDNYEDSEKDYDYIRQLFPVTAKKILATISDECDKLEYEGSCMFDEYPDRIYLGRIIDSIYDRTKYLFEDTIQAAAFGQGANNSNSLKIQSHFNQSNPHKDMIEILFFHEILSRRRRYRGRRCWY